MIIVAKILSAILFFTGVVLVLQGQCWYPMKGIFKLYNNFLPFVSSISNSFHENEEKLIIVAKILAAILFFTGVLLVLQGQYWYPMKGIFKLYNNVLPFMLSISNSFHEN